MAKIITIRAKAFSGSKTAQHRCMVDDNGTVRVYDDVAGYYTTCHSLSLPAQARVRKLAASK